MDFICSILDPEYVLCLLMLPLITICQLFYSYDSDV